MSFKTKSWAYRFRGIKTKWLALVRNAGLTSIIWSAQARPRPKFASAKFSKIQASLTKRDLDICETIGPTLREKGQIFVGIDVIGEFLTEINVTSPTGLQELERFDGINAAGSIWDSIEQKLSCSKN